MNAIYPDLNSKTVLITGATRGIGRGIALALASQKATIVFNYRTPGPNVEALKEELLVAGASAVHGLEFDLTDYSKMKDCLDKFISEFGAITGLVNNAGLSKDQLLLRVKPEDIDHTFNVNLKGTMVLTNHLAKNFLRAKDVSIVNMSSVVGLMGNSSQTVYAASKAGLIGYTKSFAKELASRHIRCNAICPGFITTEMTQELGEKIQQEYQKSIPLGEFGTVEDVANLTCFLLSCSSRYITGEIIKVDGGLYI